MCYTQLFSRLFFVISLAAFLPSHDAYAQPKGYEGYQLLSVSIADSAQLALLNAMDIATDEFEIWSDHPGIGQIDVRVSTDQRRLLEASGLRFRVEIEDMQRLYDEIFGGERGGTFFSTYRTYNEHVAFMSNLAATHPNLAQMVNLGTSVEGRILWALRITGPGANKPGVLFHGAQHGNEVMGPCVIAYMAEHLLENYLSDPAVRALVDGVEFFLLPMMNPDGYVAGTRKNAHGVDPNRNWGYQWGYDNSGSSSNPGASNYRGPGPFSEPETRAIRDFFIAHPFIRGYNDLHSAGYLLMWPWGYIPDVCPDHATFEQFVTQMVLATYQVNGNFYYPGPINTTIYPVNGGSVDYAYGVEGIWALSYEIGYTFVMPVGEIIPHCREIMAGLLYQSAWTGGCNGPVTIDCNHNGNGDACDILTGVSMDCNHNQLPDECETLPGGDCNNNGLPDICEDCNGNLLADSCDIASGFSEDCNQNNTPDECELNDCNLNRVPDTCDLDPTDPDGDGFVAADCNGNGIIDECEPDFCAPTPNPMGFAVSPHPAGPAQIAMQAALAEDLRSPPVQYLFDYVAGGGGHDSGWQQSRDYADAGLIPNFFYSYRVKARDSATPIRNETAYSPAVQTSTAIESPVAVRVEDADMTSMVLVADGSFSNLGFGQTGFYFEVSPPGGNGGNTWVSAPSVYVTGLSICTQYTLRVKARNFQGIETPFTTALMRPTPCLLPAPPIQLP